LLRHGLLVVDGPAHDQLRRLMSPALHKRVIAGYADAMLRGADAVIAAWGAAAGGLDLDLLPEVRKIALLIVFEALCRKDIRPDLTALWPAVMRTLAYIAPGPWMLWHGVPRPGYKARLQQMDDYLYRLIAAYRAGMGVDAEEGSREGSGEPAEPLVDLLGMLIASGMDDDLIRDQLLTLLIAGHDTNTATLAWSLYLLGAHPETMARARAEVDAVLGRDKPGMEHMAQLSFLDQVIKEVLRLYPPIHLGSRIAAVDLEFQGCRIPAGTRVLYSIYLTQRDPRYWDDPDRFDPQRFTPEKNAARPAYTYLPFGGGPRNCIGLAFAEVEIRLVLARLLQQFDFVLTQPGVHAYMGTTLVPRPGVTMRVTRRL
jgi:cytochrome P450